MIELFFTVLTMPGVVVHEFGHALFCFLANVKIYRIKLLGLKNPLGYVEHEEPRKFFQSLLISFGPLVVNSVLSLIMFSKVTYKITFENILYFWLGFAIALHAIPSNGDAHTLLLIIRSKIKRNPLVFVGYPFVGFIYILNLFKRFHFHFVYTAILFWLGNIYLK